MKSVPVSHVDNDPSQNNGARKGVKIQVGLVGTGTSSSSSVSRTSVTNETSTSETAAPAKTMFELCDTSQDRALSRKRVRAAPDSDRGNSSNGVARVGVPRTMARTAPTRDATQRAGPRVEFVNGQITIRESSLILDVEDDAVDGENEYEEVNEGAYATAKYSSFLNRARTTAWGIEETRRFFQALRQCGTDFSLMQAFFPGRTRRQLKLKFFREEKQFPQLVKTILQAKSPLELAPFQAHFGELLVGGSVGLGGTEGREGEGDGEGAVPEGPVPVPVEVSSDPLEQPPLPSPIQSHSHSLP